jgi:putative ABC transport system permease protein
VLWGEALAAVLDSFRGNRLRFLLTMVGLVIGAGSIVMLSGLLAGGKEALLVMEQEANERALIRVRPQPAPGKDRRRTTRPLEQRDVAALGRAPLLGGAPVAGFQQIWRTATWKGTRKAVALVASGGGADALALYHLTLARGRFLDGADLRDHARVAVVGQKVWTELFASAPAVAGLELKTGGERFTVVGVLAHVPSLDADGPLQWDSRVLIPETTFATSLRAERRVRLGLERLFVRLRGSPRLADRMVGLRRVVRSTLLRQHDGVENFQVGQGQDDAAQELIVGIVSLLVLSTTLISLAVGGINVMNIMLVAVGERTREIGVRRALGASNRHFLVQFLSESMVLAGLGGLIGVLGGLGATWIAARILAQLVGLWRFHLVPWAPPVALGASALVGLLFGVYPAWRAARIAPAEALRAQ